MTVDASFCPRCGGALLAKPPTRCPSCQYSLYVNARPTATIVVLRDEQYLVVRRAVEPFAGQWDLPGGFAEGWEHPAAAAVREAREELGVEVALGEFIGMFIGAYEHQGERLPVLDCFWTADIVAGEIVVNAAENTEVGWRSLWDPPALPFDTMNHAVRALQHRRGALTV